MREHQLYDPKIANVLNVLIFGTSIVLAAIVTLLVISGFLMHNPQVTVNLTACGIAGIYIVTAYILLRLNYYRVVTYSLVSFYLLLASGIAWNWGINTPLSSLIFGLVIVLSGMLLTARHALIAGIIPGLILLTIQTLITLDWHQSDTTWDGYRSTFGDVAAYCVVFGMLALVSWLYNREIERSLSQARQAEAALQRQKTTLKKRVEARTKDLRQLQLEEMRQMYRFAELGQQGITLLHDLANHLTALTLEIEGLEEKQPSEEITRAQLITQRLGDVVDSTRQRLNGGTQNQIFDIIKQTHDTINFLHHKAAQNNVAIEWHQPKQAWKCIGDAASFSQIIGILTSNAIDAYGDVARLDNRRVVITTERSDEHYEIHIRDWGKGIAKNQRKHLFTPHHSTKKSGLGIGLYIAKQTAEMLFAGTISLSRRSDCTEFIIRMPISK